jgi:hypothetical protein
MFRNPSIHWVNSAAAELVITSGPNPVMHVKITFLQRPPGDKGVIDLYVSNHDFGRRLVAAINAVRNPPEPAAIETPQNPSDRLCCEVNWDLWVKFCQHTNRTPEWSTHWSERDVTQYFDQLNSLEQ